LHGVVKHRLHLLNLDELEGVFVFVFVEVKLQLGPNLLEAVQLHA
jgi:hypothetical protein